MAPFSYGEYVEAVKGVAPETGDALFMKYVETGGMPFLPQLGFGTTGARQYLDDAAWSEVEAGGEGDFRFFHVTVEMP